MKINFYNETNEKVWAYIKLINNIFKNNKKKRTFDVIFVTEDEIKRINNEFRKIDKVTDVISFANVDDPENTSKRYLGEIFVCLKRAYDQAKEYGHSIKREVAFLAVHGYLHLCGYDHQTKEEEEVMFGIQEDILKKAGINRK